MADILYNDFSGGMVSPKLAGRYNSAIYHNGCSELTNFRVMLQGGLTRRPGTLKLNKAYGDRIIPFVMDVSNAFMVELGDHFAKIWQNNNIISNFQTPYTKKEVINLQHTQNYDTLYLAHRNHPPMMLSWSGSGFTFGTLVPILTHDKNGLLSDLDNKGMFTGNDCPGCVAFCSNRLWFASSKKHPYRLWASRPFNPTSFEMFDIVSVVDESLTSMAIIDAINNNNGEKTLEVKYKTVKTIRSDNAMVLEVGSNRNDRIEWLSAGRYIVVGTSSGEWLMQGSIDALNPSIVQSSSFGSAPMQALSAGSDIFFIQSGGKRVRGYSYSDNGFSSPDMAYHCDRILAPGIASWAWRRVQEPTLFCVLKNGSMAVLSYDKLYGLSAWSLWTLGTGSFLDVCVLDSEDGQDVYFMTEREGQKYIEKLDDIDPADCENYSFCDWRGEATTYPFVSRMTSNAYERTYTNIGSSIGKPKRINSATLRLYVTGGFKIGYSNDSEKQSNLDFVQEGDIKVYVPGGYEKKIKMTLESFEDKPLTLLAMTFDTEVSG